jgi:hypothetical protein
MIRKVLFSLLAGLLLAVNANAGTVTLTMDAAGGTWSLRGSSSAGDNAGIASYNIPLLGIATLTNEGPFYQLNATDFQPAGFSELRVPGTDNDAVAKTVFAGQKTIPSPTSHIVYGFGQTGGSLPGAFVAAAPSKNASTPYGANLLLASGTYSGAAPTVDFNSASLSISLFNSNAGTQTSAANVVPGGPIIPEPATLTLLGFAMVGGFGFIRRRSA